MAVMKTAFTGTILLPLNLRVRLDGSWNGIGVSSMSKILMLSSVVLMRRLTEWQHFHFWYQPRDALKSGSSLNSFAFRHSINPTRAIPMQNEVRKLPND